MQRCHRIAGDTRQKRHGLSEAFSTVSHCPFFGFVSRKSLLFSFSNAMLPLPHLYPAHSNHISLNCCNRPLPEKEPTSGSSSRPYSDTRIRQQLRDRPTNPRRLRPDFNNSQRRRSNRRQMDAVDEAAVAIQRRRFVYANNLYVKHVGSNPLSRYKTFTPAQFAASNDHKTRVIRFVSLLVQSLPFCKAGMQGESVPSRIYAHINILSTRYAG